jgi:predicted transcriptional regulator
MKMATLTIRMPEEKHNRLKALAKHRHVSINRLIDELSTQALAEFDSEIRFRSFAANGDPRRGLELLDKLDDHFSKG